MKKVISQDLTPLFVALFGPLDLGIRAQLSQTGLRILDSAVPYGFLVQGGAQAISNALTMCTTEGYRFVRAIYPLPIETRMSGLLAEWASGSLDVSKTNLVGTPDGGLVVRVSYFEGADSVSSDAMLLSYFGQAPSEYSSAFIAYPDKVNAALKAIPDIAYIEPLSIGGPSTNIAVRGEVMNIKPVWPLEGVPDSGYDGTGVTILLNDGWIDKRHDDFCLNFSDCPEDPGYNKIIISYSKPSIDDQEDHYNEAAHATHVAGILAGRGWNDGSGKFQYTNQCLCRPRPEENAGISDQPNCAWHGVKSCDITSAVMRLW